MSNDTVVSLAAPARVFDPLTELLRTGARRVDRGRGHGGVRGVPVGVRSGEAARRTAAGGSQRAPSRAQDSHRARGGGRAGAHAPRPRWTSRLSRASCPRACTVLSSSRASCRSCWDISGKT